MWEEHPEYQKAQAKLIGAGLALFFLGGVVYCAWKREWQLLRQVLLLGGALLLSAAVLSGTAWLVVRIAKRRRLSPPRHLKS